MFMKFKNYKKFIFFGSIIMGVLLLSFAFVYNNTKEKALAQEEFVWECGNEIPIGEAMDETLDMIKKILDNTDALLAAGGQQARAVNQIQEIDLPGECRAANCQTGCNISSREECTTQRICDGSCPPGAINCRQEGETCVDFLGMPLCSPRYCWDETTCQQVPQCNISPCTGNACPPDLVGQATGKAGEISALAGEISARAATIAAQIPRRAPILAKLEEARGELETCATPASGYEAEEESQLLQTLFSCEEAKFQRILSDEQESCYPTNFFCCRPVQR